MRRFAHWLFLVLICPATLAASGDDLLEADKAFALTTRLVDANTLETRWDIAPGYYMYRDKFRFESLDGRVALKPAVIPPGKEKADPLFGKVETYEKSVTIRVPLDRKDSAAHPLRVRLTGQGCNEPIGVCYPPITKEIQFSLPPLTTGAGAQAAPTSLAGIKAGTSTLGSVSSLKDLARTIDSSAGTTEPVDPEKAFVIRIDADGTEAVKVNFDVADCCYLYRDKLTFQLVATSGPLPANVRLGDITIPRGKIKNDEFIGKTEVFDKPFVVRVPVKGLADAKGASLKVGYQGCSEKGVSICYPPTSKSFALDSIGSAPVASESRPAAGAPAKAANDRFFTYVFGAFVVGLLLTFTPCVLPMIPILSSVIVGSAKDRHISKVEGGLMSGAYVLGTTVTYTVAGVVAGATGEQLQAYFQHPAMLAVFALLFAVLSLSMFGFFELQMPSFIQSHLHNHSSEMTSRLKHVKGGAFFGLFGMGMLSALIVGACVSPLLISALGVAIANRDPVLGGAIMFSMALGMGVILIAIGIGAGFLLPKAGTWMNQVKHVFGVLLLGVAIYMLGLIPEVPVLLLWAILLIVVGVYLGATQTLPATANGWQYLWKGLGTVSLIWGVAALLGGFTGNRDIMSPLPMSTGMGIGSAAPASGEKHLFERVANLRELDARLASAKAAGKRVILDYYADWCTDCIRMEKATFQDARVKALMTERFVLLQADVTDTNNPDVKAIKKRFDVFGPPALLFFGADGAERRDLRTYGFRAADEFLKILNRV